jgi:mannosylglycerate hydrolase
MYNGRIRVEVEPHEGTFSIDGKGPFGRLVDDGDSGDTYNYNPPLADTVVDRPESVTVRVLEWGGRRGRGAISVRSQPWNEVSAPRVDQRSGRWRPSPPGASCARAA